MSVQEHLEELRKTALRVFVILILAFFVSYHFGDLLSEILLSPLREVLIDQKLGQIVYLGIFDKILSQLQVAFWSSVLISSPFWFIEIWRFVRPGLYENEAKVIKPFLLLGFLLFATGVAFGYFLVFPLTFKVLMQFGVQDVAATISLKEYLVTTSKILVLLGLVFQLPNLLLILGFMGLVTKYSLREKRRYIYVAFAVLSALLTPPDPYTMISLWIPLVCLFELGVWAVAIIVHPWLERRHKREMNES
ncbi:MAG: twin-arginine translocase subunit TatC [Bdellovibrionales bacterium CG12_big_fil_rev_8_21_14_0_65_38_15]|nr:MAG: twin-arginine translocase subunit TatC [Bdellovibrionales bacterium CG22_combo_CG10-13_8_21_14_all_38_13]PIQ54086.1 MAG: twin-arginine translocase subunit TatC [Bdellovibrionales bacterium CG12_big_fil_rev_8_21_14_0_65_38_15]